MRPQTIGLALASTVTGVFLAAVAFVLVWQNMPEPRPQNNVNFKNARPQFAFNFDAPVAVDDGPFLDFDMGVVEPIQPGNIANVRGNAVAVKDYTLSEPITHGNLTIFLVHGPDTLKDSKIVTLQEAIAQGTAVVRDQGNLFVDNRGNAPLFIQAGDIVKGGNQDRTLPYDMLIPAQTNNVPLAALCVEQGRSFPRGNETSSSFHTSNEQLPTRSLKLAAYGKNQQAVWNNVRTTQDTLTRNLGSKVNGAQSQTSLQLTLEHPQVQNAVQGYVTNLAPVTAGKDDVIGYVAAVNGKVQSADIYASSSLFTKLWPKLIRASAVDALSEKQGNAAFEAPSAESVQAFLSNAEQGQASKIQGIRGTVLRQETAQTLLHDTCVPSQNNLVLHRSFLVK